MLATEDEARYFVRTPPREFTTTNWSVVLQASQSESEEARNALEHLCRTYWYPLYAFVRQNQRSVEDAQDITQEFFLRLLSHDYLKLANPELGRFRTFLLCSLRRFMISEWHKAIAQKRGGGVAVLSVDAEEGEQRFQTEQADGLSPDRIFEKRWAVTLLERVLQTLGAECAKAGKQTLFDELRPQVLGDPATASQAVLAARLSMTEGALRVAVHRLRQRYREILRDEVARTVAVPGDVDAELRELVAALRK